MEIQSELVERLNVSRETINGLIIYEQLVRKWNPAINLVAKSTLKDIWSRHIADSADVWAVSYPKSGKWIDIGSGGGFPGLVIAIIANEKAPDLSVTCIESDIRKCEFMRTVSRATGTKINILSRRAEESPAQNANFISARALAPLPKLLGLVNKHLKPNGYAYLHKGTSWQQEVEDARLSWSFDIEPSAGIFNKSSKILKIGKIAVA